MIAGVSKSRIDWVWDAQTEGVRRTVGHMPLSQANQAPVRLHEGQPRSHIVLDPAVDQ